MNQMMSEFNQRQSQPNYVMIGGGNGNTSVQRGGDTIAMPSPSPTNSRLAALGEATP
jgi:folylpolyglutamate synthase/dihydropteroate synthase